MKPGDRVDTGHGLATIVALNPAVAEGVDVLVLRDGAEHPVWEQVRPDQLLDDLAISAREQALAAQWESGTITIRPRSNPNTAKRHIFSGSRLGKTECGMYDTATADAVVDSSNYDDCGRCLQVAAASASV